MIIRFLDIFLAVFGLAFASPLMVLLLLVGLYDTGAPLFKQVRVGRRQRPFTLLKFRTMHLHSQSVGTHLISAGAITSIGRFLRRTKLDELPQLWNVLKGEMSLVGPRPCLPNQVELIDERIAKGVFKARPGITGLAQLSGIDMSTPSLLAETDAKMLASLTLSNYLKYIMLTALGKGAGDSVKELL